MGAILARMLSRFLFLSCQVLTFRVPPFYSLIVRTLTILEGLALFVDPDFRLIKVRAYCGPHIWE